MASFTENLKTVLMSFAQIRRTPLLPFFIIVIVIAITFMTIKKCSTNPHFSNAEKYFEEGDFPKAVYEAELFLEDDPTNTQAWMLLGDAHAAIAETTRGSTAIYREHVCSAIFAYRKSMGKGFNNNTNSKVAVLQMRTDNLTDSEGRSYGPCPESETTGSETGP